MTIKKWVLAGVIYLAVVVAGYSLLSGQNPLQSGEMIHDEHESSEDHPSSADGHHDGHSQDTQSEVETNVNYEENAVSIVVEDHNGDVPELVLNHEKRMHAIVISQDLEDFYHLHPEEQEEGRYEAIQLLEDGTYQVFVDIKPENQSYQIEPNEIQVGEQKTNHTTLVSEDDWTKEQNGKTVTLEPVEAVVGEEVSLNFHTHDEEPSPYLGALGHVVIVDEDVENFIHVHPDSDDSTVFNTQFSEAGMYKVWVEFKFDGEVHTYPFILEVKE